MARESVTWYKNHLAGGQTMHWELKDIRFLNDVISLFFLAPLRRLPSSKVFLECDHFCAKDALQYSELRQA